MKQTMELSYNKELWRLEPSEDRQMCLFTNLKTGEVYPLVHRNRRSITKIRQMNKTDFEYLTIEHDGKAEVRPWYYQIRLSKGKVSYLACQYVPFYMKGLYFKPREILIRKILEVNNLAEAKPKFKKLEMEGCFEYDKRSYEIIQSPEYFIVKTKKDGDVHAVYMGMEPIGLKQVSKTVFLNLYKVGKRYLLKRFQTCAEHSFYDGIGGGAIQFAERALWLDSLDCVVADEVIYGDKGLYKISSNSLISDPYDTFWNVVVKSPADEIPKPVAIVVKGKVLEPVAVGLVDRISHEAFGKAINLATNEAEEISPKLSLDDIAEKAFRKMYSH